MPVTFIQPSRFGLNPQSITGLAAWYDASDTSSITSSSGAVSQWSDKSGNEYHLVQANKTYKPTTGSTTQNGSNVLTFSASYVRNTSFNPPSTTANYVFVVCNLTTTGSRHLVDSGSLCNVYNRNASPQGRPSMYAGGPTELTASTAVWSSNAWAQVTCLFTGGANCNIRANGADQGTDTLGNQLMVNNDLTVGTYPGDPTNTGYLWSGNIAEILIYKTNIGTTNRGLVEEYLKAKWGTP